MRAVQLIEPGRLEIRDVPEPEIGSDEVLVKVAGVGLCHSDLHLLDLPEWPVPGMIMGHETAGTVAATGSKVRGFAEGDAVLVRLVWACGECRPCREGRDNVCVAAGRLGMPPCPGLGLNGGMTEYVKARPPHLAPLGSLDPATAGPLADAGLTPMHAINGARHRLTPDSTAVLIGVGGLGHMGLQILEATTDSRIIVIDSSDQKLEHARKLGADLTLSSHNGTRQELLDMLDGYGADAVFDFVGNQATVDLAAGVVAPDGALRLVGIAGGAFTYAAVPQPTAIPWGVDVRSSYGGTQTDQAQVIELVQAGKVHLQTKQYPLEEVLQAYDDLRAGRVDGRAVVNP